MKKILSLVCILLVFSVQSYAKKHHDKVSIQLNWKHQFEFAGYYMAKEKGFYKDVGLDVDIKEYKDGINIVDDVLKEKSTFGVGYPTLILDRAKGKKIVLLAAIFQSSPHVLLSLKSSGINSFKDFKGKKIMMSQNAAESATLQSMFLANGIKLKDIQIVPQSFDINDLIGKKVDIISAFSSDEPYTLKEKGLDYRIWDPKNYGFDFYDGILFTSSKELKKHPNIVKNFTKASLEGWRYAFSHISETLDVILKKYNTQHKSRKALFFEAITLKRLAYEHTKKLGQIDKNKIQRIYDIYHFMGLAKHEIDIDDFVYQINDNGELDIEELHYIKKKKVIKICANPNWEPIEFVQNGKPKGISIDIMDIVFDNAGLKYQYIKTSSWKESQLYLRDKKCDMLPSAVDTKKRELFANFTKPYMSFPLVIVTSKDKPLVQNIESIVDKTMSRKKGSALIEIFRKKYPGINILETKGYKEAFEDVENGKAYFTIATLPVLSYYKNMYDFKDLQIAGYLGKKYNLSVAVRKDDPILLSIMQKELNKIPKSVKNIIFQKWIGKKFEKKVQYDEFWKFLIIVLILFVILIARNIFTRRYNKKLEKSVQVIREELEENQKQLLQQSRLAQMGEMISMIAHQWRQPLAAISSTSSTILLKSKLNKLDKESTIELASRINEYSRHLSNTIEDFRNFFKADKKQDISNFSVMIDNVISIVKPSLDNKKITIIKDIKHKKPFKTYPNELKQVILNLVKNAEDALIENKIEVPYIKIKTYQKGGKVILEVSDNAGGIPKSVLPKIFDPYFSTKKKKDGTGIGLYMSKIIIEDHCKGKISAYNDKEGAVFEIELVLKEEYAK